MVVDNSARGRFGGGEGEGGGGAGLAEARRVHVRGGGGLRLRAHFEVVTRARRREVVEEGVGCRGANRDRLSLGGRIMHESESENERSSHLGTAEEYQHAAIPVHNKRIDSLLIRIIKRQRA
eukprot:8361852-Pyramimonas_sp.AAC.1